MPYGIVMATGGAGAAANLCGLHNVAAALTGIAILQAVWIPAASIVAQRGIPIPQWRFGLFTIPLGLAVIAVNLHGLAPLAGNIALGSAWLATLALGCWRVLLAIQSDTTSERVDGSWFLAPAALLGNAAATAVGAEANSKWEVWLAMGACLAGVAGYALVIAASGRRTCKHGLRGSPRAPWWISAGCGGLAAAALGRVADKVAVGSLHRVLDMLIAASWGTGTVLLVAVLIGCGYHVRGRSPGRWAYVWTTVFSTAVYAAGTERFARLSDIGALKTFAAIGVATTLALWTVNSALYLWHYSPLTRCG